LTPSHRYDVVIVGSGAGGGTVAAALAPLAASGATVLVLEQGPRFRPEDFTGLERDMAPALYAERGGVLTADGTMTLAFAQGYGGSTLVYTGTSLVAPQRVIQRWNVPDLAFADIEARSRRYMAENNVHMLAADLINDNNRLFVEGARAAGYRAEQFPLNLRGCRGSSLCNLGCPNLAKQGTHQVQLPAAERAGVEVVTRARVVGLGERCLAVETSARPRGARGAEGEWPPGRHHVEAGCIVLAGGVMGTVPLLLGSRLRGLPAAIGAGFTCHPAHILVAEHAREITNDVGHPKSFFVDRAEAEGFVLETCMYFPFTTAKNLTGFGPAHSTLMRAYPRLQMILVLACDRAADGNRIGIDRGGGAVAHYRFSRGTVAAMVRATRAAAKIFFAAGALRVHAPSAEPTLIEARDAGRIDQLVDARHFLPGRVSVSAAHLMGGCAMGRDARDSVTDAWGRVHGLPWLRIADASLFPDALEINPYLTIMALADRVAEGIRRDRGGRA
jgi:choline dehydrogenase-like flavoprotein